MTGMISTKLRQSAKGQPWQATVMLECAHCGASFDRGYRISQKRAAKPQFCSTECRTAKYARPDNVCETCGKVFRGRSVKTRFCSMACNTAGLTAILTPEVQERRIAAARKAKRHYPRGPDNPGWKGGKKACVQRRIADGRAAEALRKYRKANPEKVREFDQKRRQGKTGRLPRGTVGRLRSAQGNRCAICRISLRRGYHLDHIMPIARGGLHEPRNLQLLCPSCNVRKSDRDPIDHMQSLGRLL